MEIDYGSMPDLAWERAVEKAHRAQRRLEAQRRRREQAQRYKTKPQAQAPRGPRGGNR